MPEDVQFGQRLLQQFREMLQGGDQPAPDPHQIIPHPLQTISSEPYHLANHPILNALLPHLQKIFSDPGNVLGVAGGVKVPEGNELDAALMHLLSDEGLPKIPSMSKPPSSVLEARITDAYHKLDRGQGNTVTFYKLRQEMPEIPKQDFDQTVLQMTTGKESPFLGTVHDSAHRMAAMGQDVSDFVHDPDFDPTKDVSGNYFNSQTAPKGRYYVSMYQRPSARDPIYVHH